MNGDHKLVSVEVDVDTNRARARCLCSWNSGWRRDRPIAVRAVGAHTDEMTSMTVERAQAILHDHVLGLHEDFQDATLGCRWYNCQSAYGVVARAEEVRQEVVAELAHEEFRARQDRQEAIG